MFLKYSTGQIPPKKSRGKGLQGKKIIDTPVAEVDVSEESDSEPTKKRTASRRVVKKKVTISATDNIIPDPDVALELGKSISLTEAAEEEAVRQVHATHTRIVTEPEPEPAKKKTSSRNVIQALKESKKTNRKQPGTGGSNEGTGVSSGVPNESTVIPATSSEGTGTKPKVPDEEKVTYEEKVILKWGSEQESEYSEEDQSDDEEVDWIDSDEDEEKKDDIDDKSIDLEMTDYEETDDEFVHGVEQVNDEEDEEMTNAKVKVSRNGDEENTDAAKTDSGKTEEVKDDAKKAELPPTSSSLLVSSAPVTTLPLPSVSTIPHVPHQTTTPIPTPPITTDAPTNTTIVPESDALTVVQLRVVKLEKDVSKLKKIDHSAKALATLKLNALATLMSKARFQNKPTIDLDQESMEDSSEILIDQEGGDRYPFDLSKPLLLQGRPGHLTVAADYFFNNDLEFLKKSNLKRTYTTSITKTKAPRYEIVGIKDMQNVYSTQKILGVKSVSVKKLHGYGHLEEIVVKRADRQLYKFKEGDFMDLHLNDIEDMLLLVVQPACVS
ncbi:hypothetical protein Tco_1437992 [Tanacetum coccineum]